MFKSLILSAFLIASAFSQKQAIIQTFDNQDCTGAFKTQTQLEINKCFSGVQLCALKNLPEEICKDKNQAEKLKNTMKHVLKGNVVETIFYVDTTCTKEEGSHDLKVNECTPGPEGSVKMLVK